MKHEIDPKELVSVKWEHLCKHIVYTGNAIVYRKTGDKFEQCYLQIGSLSVIETKKLISEGRLFIRRNKPFKNFQI